MRGRAGERPKRQCRADPRPRVPEPVIGTLYDAGYADPPPSLGRPRLLSLATALIAGCSSGSKQSGGPLPDAATLVKQSADATKNVKSVHLVLSIQGKIPGLPIKTLTGDLTTAPATAASGNASSPWGAPTSTPTSWSTTGPVRHPHPEQVE